MLVWMCINQSDLNAQDLTALEIMTKSDQEINSDNEYATLTMKLINSRGKERSRQIEQYIKTDEADNRSSLIKFLAPGDVKGTGFLSIEYSDQKDVQWLYLPALRRSRRISASDESDNFMGSDFTYEDMEREELEAYDYTLLGTVSVDGADCYHIQAVPNNDKKRKNSGYGRREIMVRKDNFIIAQIDYFDKKDKAIKTYKASDIKQVEGSSKWRVYKMEITNLKTQHKTVLAFDEYVIDAPIKEDLFTKRYLESAD